jgi:hypothetical protein
MNTAIRPQTGGQKSLHHGMKALIKVYQLSL